MTQKYNTQSKSDIPKTRLMSWDAIKAQRTTTIKVYILELLATTDAGLTCREISKHGSIWVQSLTNPLKSLTDEGRIEVVGIKRSSVSNRLVQVYGLPLNSEAI